MSQRLLTSGSTRSQSKVKPFVYGALTGMFIMLPNFIPFVPFV